MDRGKVEIKLLAVTMALIMAFMLFPMSALSYVGALERNTGVTAASAQDGYYYLQNTYMGFYIRPDGNLTTVPSQKSLNDVKGMASTENHTFYAQTLTTDEVNPIKTDMNRTIQPSSRSVRVVTSGADGPSLVQSFLFADGTKIDITYRLVRLDKGAEEGTTGKIIEPTGSDPGRTWGVLAEAKIMNAPQGRSLRWTTQHMRFGGAGHSLRGNLRLGMSISAYDSVYGISTNTHSSAPFYTGFGTVDTSNPINITEVYTASFSYANQFLALRGYVSATGSMSDGHGGWIPSLISGVRGHPDNYGNSMRYLHDGGGTVSVDHDMSFRGGSEAYALWGFRDLYETGATNIPADPASLAADASCLGIVNYGFGYMAQPGKSDAELKALYGSSLVAVYRGTFIQSAGNYVFQNGAVQLSPSLMATWGGTGSFIVAQNGAVTARSVHLSAPTFKFYKPKSASDVSLAFSYADGKLKISMKPENNDAILHIDIPGAKCAVKTVTAALDSNIVFTGQMGISTPFLDGVSVEMKRLGLGMKNNAFGITGVEASGKLDMESLIGLDVAKGSAEINTFPGEERYAFELELNIFDMFEAEGELELTRIHTGALIPNTLKLGMASDAVGIPLVPPVVVAEINGISGGFKDLAKTINGDYSAIPPLRLTIGASGNVLKVIDGKFEITVGAGYYKAALLEGTILEMPVVDEFSWYMELAGDMRTCKGTSYKGLKLSGGMNLDLVLTKDMPFIKAGSSFNASAFAGKNEAGNTMYVVLGADGKLYGLVQIPSEAWAFGDLKLLSAELDFALGGQTTFNIAGTTVNAAVKEAFRKISGYGGVAYTGSIIGLPFRISYIFQNKKVNVEVHGWGDNFDPFDPSPYNRALFDADTGEQIGLLCMNDNLSLLATGMASARPMAASATNVIRNDAEDKGVTITALDGAENGYRVVIDGTAPDPRYLAFFLKPQQSAGVAPQDFLSGLTFEDESGATFTATPTSYDEHGQITNADEANAVFGENREGEVYVTVKLPSKGTWKILSSTAAFDIACYYASPYASLSGMSLDTSSREFSGTAKNMGEGSTYVLRTYLGAEKGGTDYLLSQSDVPAGGTIGGMIPLLGGAAPTGDYYVTTVLLEHTEGDFDGDGSVEEEETAYLSADTYAFEGRLTYVNENQPNMPVAVSLTSLGSELMRATWKAPAAGGPAVDGYIIRLYQEDGGAYKETGANYLLKTADLTAGAGGAYAFDMAVTAGDADTHLAADRSYKIGITAFTYTSDEDGDGSNESLPVESAEAQSGGEYLPKASFPKLTYSPAPFQNGENGMKLLNIKGKMEVTISSDVNAGIIVTRMDKEAGEAGEILAQSAYDSSTLSFFTPEDFEGALNLKITATDADGDITVDYLGLRLDDVAPLLMLDADSFRADYATGAFSITGVTEAYAKVNMLGLHTEDGDNEAELYGLDAHNALTADEKGAFVLAGQLNPADTFRSAANLATLFMRAEDAAGNTSEITVTQVLRNGPFIHATGVALNKTSITLYTNAAPRTEALIATLSPSDASDTRVTWKSDDPSVASVDQTGKVTAVRSGFTTVTVTTEDGGFTASCAVTVLADSGGSAALPGEPGAALSQGRRPDGPTVAEFSVNATADGSGQATANIPASSVASALEKAQKDAKAQGKTANGIGMRINIVLPEGASSLTIVLPKSALQSLMGARVKYLEINGVLVTLNLDYEALREIQKQGLSDVSITVRPAKKLTRAAKKLIGARPAYDVGISVVKDGKPWSVTSLNGGRLRLSIPYTPGKNEAAGGLFGVYAGAKGGAQRVFSSVYDANGKRVLLLTDHLSVYGVGYEAQKAKLTDVAGHWAKESIDFAVGRGLLAGITKTAFKPDAAITRGTLARSLGVLAGVNVKLYKGHSFTDVKRSNALRPYIEWACEKGVMQGVGGGRFSPDEPITREEAALVFTQYAKAAGYDLPATREAAVYADAHSIGGAYKAAVTALQQAGVITGVSGDQFEPKAPVTRAEASAMLHRYLKLTIDPATALGWTQSGSRWYYFNQDGSLSKNAKRD